VYLTKTPDFLKPIAADLVWDIATDKNEVFLTFDDGPHPEITPQVLEILAPFNAKATFFCVGKNAEKYPEVIEKILAAGHAIGNHTYNHESGWESGQYSYLKSYLQCRSVIDSTLFRPPYGRIKRDQVKALKPRCKIIMWDVLSGDFDPKRTPERCAATVLKHTKPGSIVVFHDSEKAKTNVLGALPVVLEELAKRGVVFRALEMKAPL
jgi:peptidoglycan-N-acetylglucosamine deacetylase